MLENENGLLSEFESKKLLKEAGIPTVEERLAQSPEEAVEYAKEIGFPVMMKVNSRDVQHKSDIGAVKDANDEEEVRKRYGIIEENVRKHKEDAEIEGILIEEKLEGRETIVGVSRDPVFGPVIMFGMGGIFVEVLRDVNFRVLPIEEMDARDLIEDMKTKEILEGVRGEEAVNKEAIVDVLMKISDLVEEKPNIEELDINPLFVNEGGAVAADALIRVSE